MFTRGRNVRGHHQCSGNWPGKVTGYPLSLTHTAGGLQAPVTGVSDVSCDRVRAVKGTQVFVPGKYARYPGATGLLVATARK